MEPDTWEYDSELSSIHEGLQQFSSLEFEEDLKFRPGFSRPNSRQNMDINIRIIPSSRQNTPPPLIRTITNIPKFSRQPSFLEENERREKSYCYKLTRGIDSLFENTTGHLTNSQRLFILLYTFYEIYRTVISSFLVVFVPQKCANDMPCTIYQNIIPQNDLEVAAISFNTLLAFYFCGLFFLERKREEFIKEHMAIDRAAPTGKDYLVQLLCDMPPEPRTYILKINNVYRFYAQGMLAIVCANMCISSVVIYRNYLNNNTAVVFITNALFMVNRIYRALLITSSGEYNIYSAYRSDNLIYNRDRNGDEMYITPNLSHI